MFFLATSKIMGGKTSAKPITRGLFQTEADWPGKLSGTKQLLIYFSLIRTVPVKVWGLTAGPGHSNWHVPTCKNMAEC